MIYVVYASRSLFIRDISSSIPSERSEWNVVTTTKVGIPTLVNERVRLYKTLPL
nr:MAG TPA: hypothetical protein [Caudoviricetes sp.]